MVRKRRSGNGPPFFTLEIRGLQCKAPSIMGRSYLYECSKCGYRAKVSGRADRGVHFHVQTITCRDCRQLYDAVVRLKVPDQGLPRFKAAPSGFSGKRPRLTLLSADGPPTFAEALNRLIFQNARKYQWEVFRLQCPVHVSHRVRPWNEPDACPKCGVLLEKGSIPFRIWD